MNASSSAIVAFWWFMVVTHAGQASAAAQGSDAGPCAGGGSRSGQRPFCVRTGRRLGLSSCWSDGQ